MGRRAIHWSAFSGKQAIVARASFATPAFPPACGGVIIICETVH
jgi:hypothetical protein